MKTQNIHRSLLLFFFISTLISLSKQQSQYHNKCFQCIMHPEEFNNFTVADNTNLMNFGTYDNYFCTFDKTCRGYYDKAPYRSCERGLTPCLLYASDNLGIHFIEDLKAGANSTDQMISMDVDPTRMKTI